MQVTFPKLYVPVTVEQTSVSFLLSRFLYLDIICARLAYGEKKTKYLHLKLNLKKKNN